MTDLDFDELDRAVSSLMKGKDQAADSTDPLSPQQELAPPMPDEQKTDAVVAEDNLIDKDDASLDIAAPTERAPVPESSSSKPEVPPSVSQITKKPSGVYMDMVPPAQAKKTDAASSLRDRRAKNLDIAAAEQSSASVLFHDIVAPPRSTKKVPTDQVGDMEPSTEATDGGVKETEVVDAGAEPEGAANTTWSQSTTEDTPGDDLATTPLEEDVAPSTEEVAPNIETSIPDTWSDSAALAIDQEISGKADENSDELKNEEPVADEPTSPFVAGAKVEKRPLGGMYQQAEAPISAEVSEDKDGSDMHSATLSFGEQQNDSGEQTPVPMEFHEDLLAIEADVHGGKKDQAASEPVEESQVSTTPSGPTSITQQYKEKNSSGDQSHAPIYDTNIQPLTHPAKKKSGWGVVLWIVVFIVVCIGIAAALYFTGII